MSYILIENKRASAHVLPPVPGFPEGRRLLPGANNVPVDYVQALKAQLSGGSSSFIDDKGHPKTANGWEHFLRTLHSVEMDGPWLIIHDQPYQEPKREGPPPPKSINDREPEAAVGFVEYETDPDVLRSWLKTDKREDVKAVIRTRLEELKATKK